MEIRIKTGQLTNILSILNTYAPDISYSISEINGHWELVNKYIDDQPEKLIKCRRTDKMANHNKTRRTVNTVLNGHKTTHNLT